jgi:hypothetical protein
MAQILYRANIGSKGFPFDPDNFGRSVIITGLDQDYQRKLASQEDKDKDQGLPQAFYMHNVLPTEYGYKSVGYTQKLNALPPAADQLFVSESTGFLTVDNIHLLSLRTLTGATAYHNAPSDGATIDIAVNAPAGTGGIETDRFTLTTAQVNARLFIAYATDIPPGGIYEFTQVEPIPLSVSRLLTGFPANRLDGIFASRGRLMWWNSTTIGGSSLTNPLDHAPSTITGAFNTQVQEAKGNIVYCVETLWGFIVYCQYNIIAAEFTGNIANPYIYRELYNSAGIISFRHVTRDDSLDVHYAYTLSGFLRITSNRADIVLPELTELIKNGVLVNYDIALRQFLYSTIGSNTRWSVALNFVGERYLAISVGDGTGPTDTTPYQFAFVYDTALQRWGMLKHVHTHVFTWREDNSIAFLQSSGAAYVVRSSEFVTPTDAVLALGNYQLTRGSKCALQQIEVQNREDFNTACTVHTSLQGKTTNYITTPTTTYSLGGLKIFNGLQVGLNHKLFLTGPFDINSLILTFSTHGRV